MPARAEISEGALAFLRKLKAKSLPSAREVALLLLRLERERTPEGSRPLKPFGAPLPGARVWERPDWIITYQVRNDESVFISRIEPATPRPPRAAG